MKSTYFIEYPPPLNIIILILNYLNNILFSVLIAIEVYTNRTFHTTIQQYAARSLSIR